MSRFTSLLLVLAAGTLWAGVDPASLAFARLASRRFMLDNELTLKHVRRLRGPDGSVVFTQLLPSNPAYAPIDVGGEGETRCVRILGKAVAVRFSLR